MPVVVSARPDDMDGAAASCDAIDDGLDEAHTTLATAYHSFTTTNSWGSLDASALVGNVATWIGGNRQDSEWLRTVAQAFRDADAAGAALCHATDAEVSAALAEAGFTEGRADLSVTPSAATGGPLTTGFADDPVSMSSGNFVEPEVDLAFGPTLGWLQLRRTYNSLDDRVGPFGPGWSSWASTRLRRDPARPSVARLAGPDGQVATVPLPAGTAPGFEGRVEDAGDGTLVATFPDGGGTWRFDAEGRPVEVGGAAGERVTLRWEGERLVAMAHERGRALAVEWADAGTVVGGVRLAGDRIVRAATDDGRAATYRYDGDGRLVAVDAPAGRRTYEWARVGRSTRLVAVVDADGVVLARNEYDERGRVVAQATPFGRRVLYRYKAGIVTEVGDDAGGPTSAWVHDGAGRLARVLDGHGKATTTVYDDAGRPLAVTDRRGGVTRFAWGADGRRRRVEHPDGTAVAYTWDGAGRCTSVTGPDGAFRFTYDGDEHTPATVEDPEGGITRLEVRRGLVSTVVDPDGVTCTFEHDGEGRLVAATDGAGGTRRFAWDDAGQLAAVTSPLGHTTTFRRDAAGRLVGRVGPDGAEWRVERSPAGRPVAVVGPTGERRELRRGDHGEVVDDVGPDGATTTHRWDAHGSLVATVLPDGGKWEFTHDALLRVVGVTDPGGGTWLREHDDEGGLVATVTPTGARRAATVGPGGRILGVDDGLTSVAVEYDAAGRAVAQARPDGTRATVAHDRCGRVTAVTEPGGGTTRLGYSPAGRLVAVTGPAGGTVRYAYDEAGRLVTVTDALGGRRRARYDADGRVVRVTGPTGEVTRFAYDPAGRVVAETDPAGGVTRTAYDAAGRVASVTGPTGGTTRWSYDAAGRVTAVTDPNGGTVRVERDVVGRVVATVGPLGDRTAYRLDAMGRTVEATDPLGHVTRYAYDQAGRLVSAAAPDGTTRWWRYDDSDRVAAWGADGPAGSATVTLRRDLLGRVTSVERDGRVAATRSWTPDGLLAAERVGDVRTSWEHDPAGNVAAATVAATGLPPATTRYTRDASGRVVAIDDPALGRVRLYRDLQGRPVGLSAGGAGTGSRAGGGTSRPAGDRAPGGPATVEAGWRWRDGRLVGWSRRIGDRTTSAERRHDAAGRAVEETVESGPATPPPGPAAREVRTSYGYDAAGQLVWADGDRGPWRFTYDAAGRLVGEQGPAGESRYTHDAAGRLTSVERPAGTTSVAWDDAGRRVAESGPAGERRYGWGPLGELASVRTTSAGGTARERRLAHDPFGRLAAVDDVAVAWDPTGALDRLWAVGDHRLVATGDPFTPSAVVPPAGEPTWLPTDVRHDPAGLDPWGAPQPPAPGGEPAGVPSGGVALPGDLGLGHRSELDVDGLSWLRARAYDPSTRSFLSPDPLPGVAGTPWGAHTYHYAANDPVGHGDPTGLRPLTDADLQGIRDNWDRGAWDRYGGYVVGGLMIAGGVALMFVPGVGPIAGSMMIGAAFSGGTSAIVQQATTGGVNWARVGTDTLVGAAAGGAGAWAGGAVHGTSALARLGPTGTRILAGTTENVVGGMASRALYGQNPLDPVGLATDTLTGSATQVAGSHLGTPNPSLQAADNAVPPVAQGPGTDLVSFDPQWASRQLLDQNTPGSSGYAVTPGGRTLSFHASQRLAVGGNGRHGGVPLTYVDEILDTGSELRFDPMRQTIQVRAPDLPRRPYVVVDSETGNHVVTAMIPKLP